MFFIHTHSSTHTAIRWAKLDTIPAAGSRMLEIIVRWCNGSTIVFGTISSGSNPARITIRFGNVK